MALTFSLVARASAILVSVPRTSKLHRRNSRR
jgi:hypothetical protein